MTLAVWRWLHPDYMAVSQVVLGALGLIAAVVAVVYAWRVAKRQFKMMDDQGRVIDQQLDLLRDHRELLGRIEEIEAEQKVLLHSQARLAETQFQAAQLEAARKPRLEVTLIRRHEAPRLWFVCVKNTGTRTADVFYWHLFVPLENWECLHFGPVGQGPALLERGPMTVRGGHRDLMHVGNLTRKPVFPDHSVFCAEMQAHGRCMNHTQGCPPFRLRWVVESEAGQFPTEGLGILEWNVKGPTPERPDADGVEGLGVEIGPLQLPPDGA